MKRIAQANPSMRVSRSGGGGARLCRAGAAAGSGVGSTEPLVRGAGGFAGGGAAKERA